MFPARDLRPSDDINLQFEARRANKAPRCSTEPAHLGARRSFRNSMICETGMLKFLIIHGKYALSPKDTPGQDRADDLQRVGLTS